MAVPKLRIRVDEIGQFAFSHSMNCDQRVVISVITARGNEFHLDVYPDGRFEGLVAGRTIEGNLDNGGCSK